MDLCVTSRSFGVKGFVAADVPTLRDVLKRLDDRSELMPAARQDLQSAVRKVAAVLGLPLDDIPASPGFLRLRLAKVGPAAHGLTKARWANIRSLLLRALRLSGVTVLPNRYMAPLAAPWRDLDLKLKGRDRSIRLGLARPMHFASAQGVQPQQIDDLFMAEYRRALEEESIVKNPARLWRNAIGFWNRAAREIDGWPSQLLTVPGRPGQYWVGWEELPDSLRLEAEAWLARGIGGSFLDGTDRKQLKPITVRSHRAYIRSYVSSLVASGYDLVRLRSFRDLTEVAALTTAMRFYYQRAGKQRTGRMLNEARLMLAIARHFVRVPESQMAELRVIVKDCDPGVAGMTAKNQELLRRFDSDDAKRRLVNLPHRLIAKLKPGIPLTRDEALPVQQALLVQLLLVAPMRMRNLINLEIERHFSRPTGQDGEWLILLPAEEVKNGEAQAYLLSDYSRDLLRLYLKRARPVLMSGRSIYLFPCRDGQTHKADCTIRHLMTSITFQELGVRITPHQYRHLCGKFVLDVRPDAHELVRSLLGHKRIETTIRFYARTNQERAARQYDRLIADLRSEARLEV